MKIYSQDTSKVSVVAPYASNKKAAIGLASLFILAAGMVYSFSVQADTNAAGVEIEYINEPNLLEDPLQDLLADMNAAHESNTGDVADSDLWTRIKDGYELPEVKSPYTSNHEQWYSSRPDYIQRMVERSQRYLYHIVEEVQKRGMPTEIALLPMIESAFNPQAVSSARAAGSAAAGRSGCG